MNVTLSVIVTTALLVLLALRDPKRSRHLQHLGQKSSPSLTSGMRKACACACLLPGIALAAAGAWWGFFIWLGLATSAGWLLAMFLAQSPGRFSSQ